jgi:hypothetical protein
MVAISDCPIVSAAERKALHKAIKRSLKEAAAVKNKKKTNDTTITLDEYHREVEVEEEIKRSQAELALQDPNEPAQPEPQAGPSTMAEEPSDDNYILLDVDPFTVFDVKMTNECVNL